MKNIYAILFTAALLATSIASAQPGPMWHEPFGGAPGMGPGGCAGDHMVAAFTKLLTLTDKQVTAWATIRTKTEKAIEPLATQVRQMHESIHTKLENGNADPTDVGQMMIEAFSIETQIRATMDSGKEAFRGLLTTDQQSKLDCFEKNMEMMRLLQER